MTEHEETVFEQLNRKGLIGCIKDNPPERGLKLRGEYTFEVLDDYNFETGEGKIVHFETIRNGIVTEGITDMFEQYMRAGTGITPSIGLIDATSFSQVLPGDTMASHAGWVEITDYSESTRPTWSPDAAANAQINNSTKVLFTMTAAKNSKGLFVTSDSEKGGTGGVLFNTAVSTLTTSLQAGQVARAGYALAGVGA